MRRIAFLMILFSSMTCAAEWTGGAEALYWKPAMCTVPYGERTLLTSTENIIESLDLLPDLGWGGRGWLGFRCGWLRVEGSYLYVRPCARADVGLSRFDTLDFYTQGEAPMSSISSRLDVRYQRADVRVGWEMFCWPGLSVTPHFLVGWLDLDFDLSARGPAVGTDAPYLRELLYRSSSRGGLLGVGFDGEAYFAAGLRGLMRGALSVGLMDARIAQNEARVDAGLNLALDPYGTFQASVAFEGKLGLDWGCSCGCGAAHVTLAYEVHHYVSALYYSRTTEGVNVTQSMQINRDIVLPDCLDIGFAGPTLGVSVCY